MSQFRFCSNCGASHLPQDKFCKRCGHKILRSVEEVKVDPQPPPSPSPSITSQTRSQGDHSSSESILGTIINCKTIFPSINYILFFSDRRIIIAKKGLFSSFTEGGAATGGILGALIGAGVDATLKRSGKEKVDQLHQLTPDQILAKDKNNREILFNNIKVIELKNPGFLSDGEIKIKVPDGEYNWIMEVDKDEFKKVITIIQNILPNKVLIK